MSSTIVQEPALRWRPDFATPARACARPTVVAFRWSRRTLRLHAYRLAHHRGAVAAALAMMMASGAAAVRVAPFTPLPVVAKVPVYQEPKGVAIDPAPTG